jgi:hypothetical protein
VVKLFNVTSGAEQNTNTDATGAYTFDNLPCDPTGTYEVEFELQSGDMFSPANQGGDETLDSDADVMMPGGKRRTGTLVLPVGTDETERADAGLYTGAMITIGDYVWEDDDCNGVQDDSDPVAGVTLELYRNGETTPITTTISDGSGAYEFEVPQNTGNYYVVAELSSGYVFSPGDQQPPATDETDSDIESYFVDGYGNVDMTRGSSWSVPSDTDHLHVDVGLCPAADTITIGDYVWEDADCDGYQDSSENGKNDVTVSLYRKDDNTEPYFTTVSSDNGSGEPGYYTFEVPKNSGDYHVVATLPSNYMFSPGDVASADDDSDIVAYFVDSSGGVDYSRGRATNGNAESTNDRLNRGDVGLCPDTNMGTIGDYVWYDDNGNGQQNGGESGMEEISVQLRCEIGGDWKRCFETQTDANGQYHFDVWPGRDYEVWFHLPNDPDDYEFTTSSADPSSPNNSDIDSTSGDWGETSIISVDPAGGNTDYTDYADAGIDDD